MTGVQRHRGQDRARGRAGVAATSATAFRQGVTATTKTCPCYFNLINTRISGCKCPPLTGFYLVIFSNST
ncbi:hypothetical protein RHMOL_Rhmol10G0301500 [Rhododendron molle]|uniref:Uncharacterized protein n=1 Tax=Rhododendron molle TaxID=49168 RepID=A0ACC0M7S0_RHOML|nr:hypothetical protein RHMOL_Rhmol10G0301500 [Rhododendron molle]